MHGNSNGFVGPSRLVHYRAPKHVGASINWSSGQVNGPWTLREIDEMLEDSSVQFGLSAICAPLHRARLQVRCKDQAVGGYVAMQLKRFWGELEKVLSFIAYGNAAAEVTYTEREGRIELDCLNDVYLGDALPLAVGRDLAGIQVQRATDGGQILRPRSLWISHRPKHGSFWGVSRLRPAWPHWKELAGRDGARDLRRLWYLRDSTDGGTLRFPQGDIQTDAGTRSAESYAQELSEKMKAGGLLNLPSDRDPVTKEYLWVREPPVARAAGDLRDYLKDVDQDLLRGLGVPPEVLQATGETGSGYAGRSIPAEVFWTGEEQLARAIVAAFKDQVGDPLVAVNYGPDVTYEIDVLPMAPWAQQDGQGGDAGQKPPGGEPGPEGEGGQGDQEPPSPGEGTPPGGEKPPLSLGAAFRESDHPRDRKGQFIEKGALAAAARDSGKAEELRKRVRPEDAKKLESALKEYGGKQHHTKEGKVRLHAADMQTHPGEWHAVESDAVSHARYDPKTGDLLLRFQDEGGVVYRYSDVSAEDLAELSKAGSFGTWVNKHLKQSDRAFTIKDIQEVLDPAFADPDVLRIQKEALKIAKQPSKGAELATKLAAMLKPKKDWTVGYAQQAAAAMLSVIPHKNGKPQWTTENSTVLEPLFAMALDHGWVHHGKTGAADISSGQKTYKTKGGLPVVFGIDTKASRGAGASFAQDAGAQHQKAQFVAESLAFLEDDSIPDEVREQLAADAKAWLDQGLAAAPRVMAFVAGVDVARQGKSHGFAYLRFRPGGGGYAMFKPKQEVKWQGQTYPAGEQLPPEVLSAMNAKQREKIGFDPLKHDLPIRIEGLQSPEDLVRNPRLMQQLHKGIEDGIAGLDYEGYRGAMAESLDKARKRLLVQSGGMGTTAGQLGGGPPRSDAELAAEAAAKAEKGKQSAQKRMKKFKDALGSVGQNQVDTAISSLSNVPKAARPHMATAMVAMLQHHVAGPHARDFHGYLDALAEENPVAHELMQALGLERLGG